MVVRFGRFSITKVWVRTSPLPEFFKCFSRFCYFLRGGVHSFTTGVIFSASRIIYFFANSLKVAFLGSTLYYGLSLINHPDALKHKQKNYYDRKISKKTLNESISRETTAKFAICHGYKSCTISLHLCFEPLVLSFLFLKREKTTFFPKKFKILDELVSFLKALGFIT